MTNHSNDTNGNNLIKRYDEQGNLICNLTKHQEDTVESNSKTFIVPPCLVEKMFDFHGLIETSKGQPILITGPTGVGKSLFIHMYCEWYKEKYGEHAKITNVNCSHFEKGLSRSELFGHVRGAFTGADKDKKGWIEVADGGLLILDEIGELPDECQAQLLTFIEDGKYHKVGESKVKEAKDLRIVGATNREWDKPGKQLRDDLWNRFITFSIPPLYKRREDILYYIAAIDAEVIKELRADDVLMLLAYNWPGNVREIGRVISVIKSRHYLRNNNPIIRWRNSDRSGQGFYSDLGDLEREHTNLSLYLTANLCENLDRAGFDIESLEHLLNNYGTGLDPKKNLFVFKNFKEYDLHSNHETMNPISFDDLSNVKYDGGDDENKIGPLRYNYKDQVDQSQSDYIETQIMQTYQRYFKVRIPTYHPFKIAMMGYELFCRFFLQNIDTYRNVFIEVLNRRISVKADINIHTAYPKEMTDEKVSKEQELIAKISQQAFDFMKGVLKSESILPKIGINKAFWEDEKGNIKDVLDGESFYRYERDIFLRNLDDIYFYNTEDIYTTILEIETQSEGDIFKNKNEPDIFTMTEKEFAKYYYEGLLKRYPTTRKIAKVLDLDEQTMYSKFRALRKKKIIS